MDPQFQESNVGKKDFYRVLISLSVFNVSRLCNDLEFCLQFGCQRPNDTYRAFVSEFNALYTIVGMVTNNLELAKEIEQELAIPWAYKNRDEYENKSRIYINLFKKFLIQLKEDGIYNPEITKKNADYENIWTDSI